MSNRFCTNCGTQIVEGTAFCTSCGAPAAAAEPAQPGVQPPPAEAPPPAPPPPPSQEAPPPFAAPPFVAGPFPTAGPAAAKPPGASRKTLIGIAIMLVLAIVIAVFVQRSEREFQRKRRAGQTSLATSGSPSSPNDAAGAFYSGGAAGQAEWTRNQIVGRWTETRECGNPIEFRADGTTNSGRWAFGDGRLSLIESTGTVVVELVSIGTQEMVLADLSTRREMTWRRC